MKTRILLATMLLVGGTMASKAQNQPITNPQDAHCRNEARDTVFTASNPKGLSPFALGAQLYHACMRRIGAAQRDKPRR